MLENARYWVVRGEPATESVPPARPSWMLENACYWVARGELATKSDPPARSSWMLENARYWGPEEGLRKMIPRLAPPEYSKMHAIGRPGGG